MSEIKEYAVCLAESLSYLNERVAPRQRPTRTTNMGFSKKKCKSCKAFEHCQATKNRNPQGNACNSYKPKKRR